MASVAGLDGRRNSPTGCATAACVLGHCHQPGDGRYLGVLRRWVRPQATCRKMVSGPAGRKLASPCTATTSSNCSTNWTRKPRDKTGRPVDRTADQNRKAPDANLGARVPKRPMNNQAPSPGTRSRARGTVSGCLALKLNGFIFGCSPIFRGKQVSTIPAGLRIVRWHRQRQMPATCRDAHSIACRCHHLLRAWCPWARFFGSSL